MCVLSLRPHPLEPVPEDTARGAPAAFPTGNPSLLLRDTLGTIFQDDDFAACFPRAGQPGLPPWRLALVTRMPCREHLADRHAAEAVRARIDWQYLLGLALTDPGLDFSVRSEFRDRLLASSAAELLLGQLLERCRALGWLKARGLQRTDSTPVLAAIRGLNRLELVAETLRATLNELATVAPDWLRGIVPVAWYERYGKRIEDTHVPKDTAHRAASAQAVGEDGFHVLDALEAPEAPKEAQDLASLPTLRRTWQRHDDRLPGTATAEGTLPGPRIRFKADRALPPAAEGIASPYDPDARSRHKRDTPWTGSMVPVSETCEPTAPHLLTPVHTTTAAVHEAQCTPPIQAALVAQALPPRAHLVDAASMAAAVRVSSREDHGITRRGPARPHPNWQATVEGADTQADVVVDWERQQGHCPQGHTATSWAERSDARRPTSIQVRFRPQDCRDCGVRARCTQAPTAPRTLTRHPQAQSEALPAARAWYASAEGQQGYKRRAGIEGTLSQGVRAFGLRHTRYRGTAKTHLQHIATAAAINIDRIVAWVAERPRAQTRLSRFAALAPVCLLSSRTLSV
jgi:transposase